jgi:hypothetical protein
MIVDGLQVVYTIDVKNNQVIVHMPGRISQSIETLKLWGRQVTPPRRWRTH